MKKIAEHITIENVAMVVLFIFGAGCAISTVNSLQRNYELLTRVRENETKNQVLELEIANFRLRKIYHATDEFIELQARSKLNKALPGENLVLLPKTEPTVISEKETISTSQPPALTNSQKWAQFLLGISYD